MTAPRSRSRRRRSQGFDHECDGAGATAALSRRSQPMGEYLLTLVRYALPILAVSLLTMVGVQYLTKGGRPEPVAQAQIGLTDAVRSEFHEAARARIVELANDPGFGDELRARLAGVAVESVEVTSPDSQTVVDIVARSDTAASAALVANTASGLLLERDLQAARDETRVERDRAQAVLEASRSRVDELNSQIGQLIITEAEAATIIADDPREADARESFLTANASRSGLVEARNAEIRRQVALQRDAALAAVAADNPQPRFETIIVASPPRSRPDHARDLAIAGFLGTAIAGIGVATRIDRSHGAVTSRWYAERMSAVPVFGEIPKSDGDDDATARMLAHLVEMADDGARIIAVNSMAKVDVAGWVDTFTHQLTQAGYRVVQVVDDGRRSWSAEGWNALDWTADDQWDRPRLAVDGRCRVVLPSDLGPLPSHHLLPALRSLADGCDLVLVAGGPIGDDVAHRATVLADTTLLLTRRGGSAVDELRRAADVVLSDGRPLLGTVLISGGRAPSAPVTSG